MKVAFITYANTEEASAKYPYVRANEEVLAEAFVEAGHGVEGLVWDRATDEDLARFDVLLFRSPWDYYDRWEEFDLFLKRLTLLEKPVFNPVDMVRWNTDKAVYLPDLAQAGIGVMPMAVMQQPDVAALQSFAREHGAQELVVKKSRGAGGRDVKRVNPFAGSETKISMAGDVPLIVQPFLPEILTEGEYSLIFFDGVYSHTVRKTIGRPDEFRINRRFDGRVDDDVDPPPQALTLAKDVMEVVTHRFSAPPLYARIDGIPSKNMPRGFGLIELELFEPVLYFNDEMAKARRFVQAVERRAG